MWLVGTGTSWSSEPQVLLVLGSAYDHGREWLRVATPTPDGLAAIYERDPQTDPSGFLGPWVLPLTVFSNVLFNFGGGPGRVAIHGRDGASLSDPLGSARSHGCIRIDNTSIDWMAANIPQGTQSRSLVVHPANSLIHASSSLPV